MMVLSASGVLVCIGLIVLGYLLRAPILIGLFASLPMGATAIGKLSGLGGSSPLLYSVFGVLLCASLLCTRGNLRLLGYVFASHWVSWIVAALVLHSAVGAFILPRLFAGETSALVPVGGIVREVPLAPVSGNVTQTAYFALSAAMFFGFCVVLRAPRNLAIVRRGYFAWITVFALLGGIDLAGKLAGAGDILAPMRTASYSLLTEVEQSGFWRITGGFSEASAFGGVGLSCLAFTVAYWRVSRSPGALMLALALLALLSASTSSAAYAGGAILALLLMAGIGYNAMRGRITLQDIDLCILLWIGIVIILSLYVLRADLFDPVVRLLETTVLEKGSSESAQERGYWNYRSMVTFLETGGLGIGLGSSRASSWPIAVLSQLGALGALLMALLMVVIIRGSGQAKPRHAELELVSLASGARASVVASLVAGSMIGSGADPGLLFFIGLAVIVTCRRRVSDATVQYGHEEGYKAR